MNTLPKYAAVFGRKPAFVSAPENEVLVSTALFPALKRSFWRGLMSEAHDLPVAITLGLSEYAIQAPEGESERIELIAFPVLHENGNSSENEVLAIKVLHFIANGIVDQKMAVGVGHTLDLQQRIVPGSDMSAVLFALPFGVDVKRIMKCSRAGNLLNVVPITPAELRLVREEGVGALLDVFELAGVNATFDCSRDCAVS